MRLAFEILTGREFNHSHARIAVGDLLAKRKRFTGSSRRSPAARFALAVERRFSAKWWLMDRTADSRAESIHDDDWTELERTRRRCGGRFIRRDDGREPTARPVSGFRACGGDFSPEFTRRFFSERFSVRLAGSGRCRDRRRSGRRCDRVGRGPRRRPVTPRRSGKGQCGSPSSCRGGRQFYRFFTRRRLGNSKDHRTSCEQIVDGRVSYR